MVKSRLNSYQKVQFALSDKSLSSKIIVFTHLKSNQGALNLSFNFLNIPIVSKGIKIRHFETID